MLLHLKWFPDMGLGQAELRPALTGLPKTSNGGTPQAFTYSRESCFSGDRFCFHRVSELFCHRLSVRRDRFGADERGLAPFLHGELYRIAVQYFVPQGCRSSHTRPLSGRFHQFSRRPLGRSSSSGTSLCPTSILRACRRIGACPSSSSMFRRSDSAQTE